MGGDLTRALQCDIGLRDGRLEVDAQTFVEQPCDRTQNRGPLRIMPRSWEPGRQRQPGAAGTQIRGADTCLNYPR